MNPVGPVSLVASALCDESVRSEFCTNRVRCDAADHFESTLRPQSDYRLAGESLARAI